MSRKDDNGFVDWGGYMDAKITKLEEQFAKSSDPFRQSNLFEGISIYVNGLTNPSSDELKRIMMIHGGTFHHYQRSHTSFVIASNLPDVKIRNMNTSKIISPQWIVDCLKEKRILDYSKYLLYTNQKPSQPKINFQNKKEIKLDTEKKPDITNVDSDVSSIKQDLQLLNKKMLQSPPKDKIQVENDSNEVKPSANALSPDIFEDNDSLSEKLLVSEIDKGPDSTSASRSTRTARDPKFLSEFYNNSRLHHIATLGAGFKQYVSELREKHAGDFPARNLARQTLQNGTFNGTQTIMHIDMDCFFVSVGLRSRPHLRNKPVAVTHSKGAETVSRPGVDRQKEMELYMKRLGEKLVDNVLGSKADKIKNGFERKESLSEIASCSYEARKMGVRNGMFMGQALKLCPDLKTIPYDFEGYKEVAFTLYDTIAQYTLDIEAVSCDEMFVDLTKLLIDLQVEPMKFVEFVRNEIKSKTSCPCSAGVGSNRLQARMATKKAKPDGQFYLDPEIVEEYMSTVLIKDLPGVGYSTSYTLEQLNWKTCGDLQQVPLTKIQNQLGKKFGETLYQFCRGIDNRPLVYGQIRKSVSAEVNYGIRFTEYGELETFLRQLCTEVHSRLMDIKRKGRVLTLKIMVRAKEAPQESSKFMGHGFCDHFSKSISLAYFTNDLEVITKNILSTMKNLNIPPKELRGIGIQISKLDTPNESGAIKKENILKTMFKKVTEKQKEQKPPEVLLNEVINIETETIPQKTQTENKSPVKGENKTNKKGRGKPTKNKGKTADIGQMLKKPVPRKRSAVSLEYGEIDLEVLEELPDDIKKEILANHNKISKAVSPRKQSTPRKIVTPSENTEKMDIDPEFLEALPPNLRKEVEEQINNKIITSPTKESSSDITSATETSDHVPGHDNLISSDNIFIQNGWKELIHAWLDSTESPESCDVQLLAKHAREIVKAKKIYDLYVPMKFLCRVINAKPFCNWHAAYKAVVDNMQEEMMCVYGSRMFLNVKIDCDKC